MQIAPDSLGVSPEFKLCDPGTIGLKKLEHPKMPIIFSWRLHVHTF